MLLSNVWFSVVDEIFVGVTSLLFSIVSVSFPMVSEVRSLMSALFSLQHPCLDMLTIATMKNNNAINAKYPP